MCYGRLVAARTNQWWFREDDAGCLVTVRHEVGVRYAAITGTLGSGATPADAHAHVRSLVEPAALSTLERLRELT